MREAWRWDDPPLVPIRDRIDIAKEEMRRWKHARIMNQWRRGFITSADAARELRTIGMFLSAAVVESELGKEQQP